MENNLEKKNTNNILKTILYYIFFTLGVCIIFGAIAELLLFADPSQAVSGFLGGIIFLFIAGKFRSQKNKNAVNK